MTTWPTDDETWTDLGHGVEVAFFVDTDVDGPAGLIERHDCADGRSMGSIPFELPVATSSAGPRWKVEQRDPLTISPSVLCRRCGLHGFIRDGRWIPA